MPPIDYISSYVEALVGLLVFGISIPTIIMNVPPRLRAIRDQYGRDIEIGRFKFKASKLVSVELVVVIIIVSIGLLLLYQLPSPPFFCNVNPLPASLPVSGFGCSLRHLYVSAAPYWINFLLLFDIVFTAAFIWILRSYSRDQIIHQLGNVCRQQALTLNGQIEEDLLLNLGELGELCEPGKEKQSVLKTLEELSDLKITPSAWADIARAVTQTTASGNERNVIQALEMLQEIFRLSSASDIGEAKMKPFKNRDILKELASMFIQAFDTDSPGVRSKMLTGYDELAQQEPNNSAKAFLDIGRLALKKDSFIHAVNALDKLHTLITELLDENSGECPPNARDAFHMYFALAAYFWNHGAGARQHALRYLYQLCDDYGWDEESLNTLISQAGGAMKRSSLHTADMLEQMLYSNRQIAMVRKVLEGVKDLDERHQERILLRFSSLEELNNVTVTALMACGISTQQAETILYQSKHFP